MSDKTYNGWTNYATWRINLEIFDGISLDDFDGIDDKVDPELVCAYTLGEALKERAEYYIECSSDKGLARDYALAFLSDVNWHEIAKHMIADYAEVTE
jgi:hypothetical protein